MKTILAFLFVCSICSPLLAWSEGGHHLIAVLAFEQLDPDIQSAVLDVLSVHPRFKDDFAIPEKAGEADSWLIGRAGYWPDISRSQPMYNRPNWHWQLGSNLTIGDVKNVPQNPGQVPADATLDTKDLHIAQAIELCRRILHDELQPKADRAIALCWICHLVGDAHQPCHAGSMYDNGRFTKGDRGANQLPTVQSKNMHSLWDGLLGRRYDAGDVRRRAKEIRDDAELWKAANEAAVANDGLSPAVWLAESGVLARSFVYAPEVLRWLEAGRLSGGDLRPIDLSDQYLKSAGELAQRRTGFAAHRLAKILASDVGDGQK